MTLRQLCASAALAVAWVAFCPAQARAQGFFSPFIGYDYGGDSLCQTFRGCEEKNLNIGFSFGKLGRGGGFEEEIAWAKDFFGKTSLDGDSSVLTVMSNVMVAPKIGPVRPYGLFGLGLMKARVNMNPVNIVSFSNNMFAWDLGGGVMVFFGDHVGVRGEIRHFHSFQSSSWLPVGSDAKLNFGRASAALVLLY